MLPDQKLKIELHNKAQMLIEKCKSHTFDKNKVNIYRIDNDKIFLEKEIPHVTLHDTEKADGSIIIYHTNTNFYNCNFVLRKKCVILFMPSQYKINKLAVLNNNGHGSLCFFGEDFSCMGAELRLWEYKNIFIGNDTMFSWNVMLFTSDGHSILNAKGELINVPDDIVISDHVWIGQGVKILKGSFVGKNSIVGTSSIVAKKYYDENVILSGNPAIILRTGVTWSRKRMFTPNDESL